MLTVSHKGLHLGCKTILTFVFQCIFLPLRRQPHISIFLSSGHGYDTTLGSEWCYHSHSENSPPLMQCGTNVSLFTKTRVRNMAYLKNNNRGAVVHAAPRLGYSAY